MRLSSNELFKAVRFALYASASAVVGFAAPAIAQDAQDQGNQRLETITVTGSNIRRVDIETSNPVITVDRAQIQKSGKLTVGDLLQSLPAVAGAPFNPYINNGGGTGSSTIDLRGLGTARTLTLVNGHRAVDPDVNTIPTNLIERIEVLTDGASAIYGSDAIAGVVNIILRSDYQGAEFSTNYGISDRDDGQRQGYSFTFGHSTDRGSIMGGVNYNKQDGVLARNRKFAKDAIYYYNGQIQVGGGSATGATGRIQLPDNLAAQFGCANAAYNGSGDVRDLSNYHCYRNYSGDGPQGQGDRFNFQAVGNQILTPQERASGFVVGNYKLTDSVTAYLEVYATRYSSKSQIAPLPVVTGAPGANLNVTVSADNYYNPFGVDFGPGAYGLSERMLGFGNRTIAYTTDTYQVQSGFKGTIGESSWQWDANFGYGHTSQLSKSYGYFYSQALVPGLGPSFFDPTANGGAGAVVCGTPGNVIEGCTPINIFAQAFDPTVVDALRPAIANPFAQQFAIERVYSFNINGTPFELPAGSLGVAGGVSYRKEYLNNQVDYIAIADESGSCFIAQEACGSNLQGSYNVKEAYVEAFVPVLKDIPFVHSLNVTLGDRYSKYNTFGNTNNWKVGVEWRPIEDLLLRGTVSTVFRAPTISNLFAGPQGNAPTASDPCANLANPPAGACPGVPPFMPPAPNSQITGVVAGSNYFGFPLGPEDGKSFDFGVVYDPHWLEGLSLSGDVYRIYLNNLISTLPAQLALTQCFTNGAYCQFIVRDQTGGPNQGQISYVQQPTVNLGRLDTKGADFALHYKLPETVVGKFSIDFQTTYIAQYDNQPEPGATVNHVAGHYWDDYGNYARWRALLGINWALGNLDASWNIRYVGPFSQGSFDPSQNFTDDGLCAADPTNAAACYHSTHYGAQVVNNLQVGYNIEPINTRVDFGVDNVFDKQPPILYNNNVTNANTDPGTYWAEMLGRYYWGRITVKF